MASDKPRRVSVYRHDGWTPARRATFLEMLAEAPNVARACRAVGKSHTTAYALRRRDTAFAAAWDAAIGIAIEGLFGVMVERANNGSTRTVRTSDGRERTIHDYSDRLGMFLLARYDSVLRARLTAASAAPQTRSMTLAEEVDIFRTLAEAYHAEPVP